MVKYTLIGFKLLAITSNKTNKQKLNS